MSDEVGITNTSAETSVARLPAEHTMTYIDVDKVPMLNSDGEDDVEDAEEELPPSEAQTMAGARRSSSFNIVGSYVYNSDDDEEMDTFEEHAMVRFALGVKKGDAGSVALGGSGNSGSESSTQLLTKIRQKASEHLHLAELRARASAYREYAVGCRLELDHADWRDRRASIRVTRLPGNPRQPTADAPHEVVFDRDLNDIDNYWRTSVDSDPDVDRVVFRSLPSSFADWDRQFVHSRPGELVPTFHPPYNVCGDIGLVIDFLPEAASNSSVVRRSAPRNNSYTRLELRFPTAAARERLFTALRRVQASLMLDALRDGTDAVQSPPVVDVHRTRPSFDEMQKHVAVIINANEHDEAVAASKKQQSEAAEADRVRAEAADAAAGRIPEPPNGGIIGVVFPNQTKQRRLRLHKETPTSSADGSEAPGQLMLDIIPASVAQKWRGVPDHTLKVDELRVRCPESTWGDMLYLERRDPETNRLMRLELIAKNFEDRLMWLAFFKKIVPVITDGPKEEVVEEEDGDGAKKTTFQESARPKPSNTEAAPPPHRTVTIAVESEDESRLEAQVESWHRDVDDARQLHDEQAPVVLSDTESETHYSESESTKMSLAVVEESGKWVMLSHSSLTASFMCRAVFLEKDQWAAQHRAFANDLCLDWSSIEAAEATTDEMASWSFKLTLSRFGDSEEMDKWIKGLPPRPDAAAQNPYPVWDAVYCSKLFGEPLVITTLNPDEGPELLGQLQRHLDFQLVASKSSFRLPFALA